MKRLILATVSACALLGGAAYAETLRIATEGAYPPFNFREADGTLAGLEVDLANALCAQMQRDCEIVAQDWDGMIPALQAEKYDAIMATMSITQERLEKIDFSKPYLVVPAFFVSMADRGLDGTAATMTGKRVGVQRGTTHERYLEANFKDVVEIVTYDTAENALIDMKLGRVDAIISNGATAGDWMAAEDGKDLMLVGEPMTDAAIFGPGVGVGLPKGDAELKAAFDAAIDAVLADGTFDTISAKYTTLPLRP
jgi:octopine/nopaline transport system substrate-binding protein